MSKRLDQLRANPQAGWTIQDVVALCREYGLICEPPRGGGSHYKVAHPDLQQKLTVPYRRPIKPVYIRRLVSMIDALEDRS